MCYVWKAIDNGLRATGSVSFVLPTHVVKDGIRGEGNGYEYDVVYTREHTSGWAISAKIRGDYYAWVSEFTAVHPEHGKISGDFGKTVTAESKQALDHFLKHHKYKKFDYGDI